MLELFTNILQYVAPVTGVITAATAVTAITPTRSDDKIINIILKILNIVAGNVLKNANKDS